MGVSIHTAGEQLQLSLEPVMTKEERLHLSLRIGSALLAGVFYLTGKLYIWLFPDHEGIAGIILFLGAIIAGFSILKSGFEGFFARKSTCITEQLVSLAILAAVAKGDYETAILIPILMSVAHILEERSILGGRAAIEGLKTLQVKEACLITPEGEKVVPSKNLTVGDRIIVRAGEMFSVDGKIIKGKSSVDQSSMTGETIPIDVKKGDQVFAGTVNIQGLLEVEVIKEVEETSLSKIVDLLKDAENSRTPIMRRIEKYISYYQPAILLIAACTLFMTKDMNRVIAVLVVSCPCAQILASSTAMISSLAVSTRNGILIKNSTFLEVLGAIKTIVFDKTGTLTEGHLDVLEVNPVEGVDEGELLAAAVMVAQGSTHPVSRAIVRVATDLVLEEVFKEVVREVAVVEESAGMGVSADTPQGKVILGNRSWLESLGIVVPFEVNHYGQIVWVARASQVLGCILMADKLRSDAKETIEEIRGLGIERTVLLTGDREQVAKTIGQELDLDQIYSECLPSEKLSIVEEEMKNGSKVMVVGDGVNDALALATSDVGIAMGAMGSDIAVKSADMALMTNNLQRLPFIIKLSRKTNQIIHQNLILASISSITMIILASMGIISPMVGAFFHNIGGFMVLLNSARLLRFDRN
ncbi:MAG: cadmium-translocating P-type ATPase [Halanaerobiales bacterium]|nr:cadmium-translocating P-type ATPase [Halanaerobiales bacterium]